MELKEFINTSLEEISTALSEFGAGNNKDGISLFPTLSGSADQQVWADNNLLFTGQGKEGEMQYATIVSFDVAVTAEGTSEEATDKNASIKVCGLNLGGGGKSKNTDQETRVSKISFKVPLQVKISETVIQRASITSFD